MVYTSSLSAVFAVFTSVLAKIGVDGFSYNLEISKVVPINIIMGRNT